MDTLGPEQKTAKNKILDSLPRVDVQGSAPASVDVTLEHGGAVSGNITYDDGGPAAGLQVQVLARMLRDGKETWSPVPANPFQFLVESQTDDRGNYRISSLPPGKYAIEVILAFTSRKMFISASGTSTADSNAHSALLEFYSGNTPRQKDAACFKLQAREERGGEDIVIPMSKLHTIKGSIVSAHDGHLVNGGGVYLLHADDHSLAGQASLTEDDPSFTFSFIFEGDYILSSPMSADVDYEPAERPAGSLGPVQFNTHTVHFYGASAIPLHVKGDMDGVTIDVPEPTPKEAQMDQEMMRQEKLQEKPATDPQ